MKFLVDEEQKKKNVSNSPSDLETIMNAEECEYEIQNNKKT